MTPTPPIAGIARESSALAPTRRPALWAAWLAVFLAAFALYALTANRGPQWQDSGHFIVSIMEGRVRNPLGLALSHPLHHQLGRLSLYTGLEPAWAITLVSALGGALTVANLFGLLRTLTGHARAALWAAAGLAVAHTFWSLSTVTEVYTLSTALMAAECWAWVVFLRRGSPSALLTMMACSGLGLSNHLQALLTLPVTLAVAWAGLRRHRLSWRWAGPAGGLWVLGASLYLDVVLREALTTGAWTVTLRSALFGGGQTGGYAPQVLNLVPNLHVLLVTACFTLLSFPNLLLPAAGWGVLRLRALAGGAVLWKYFLAAGMIHVLFAARYSVVDQYTFFLPTYYFTVILAGGGAALWLERPNSPRTRWIIIAAWAGLLATPLIYAVVPNLARSWGLLDAYARHKPYRDDYVYFLTPWSVMDDSAQRMSMQAADLAGPGGVVLLEDPMARYAVRYQQLRRDWSNMTIESAAGLSREAFWQRAMQLAGQGRQVAVVPADTREAPPADLAVTRTGDLYVIAPFAAQPTP